MSLLFPAGDDTVRHAHGGGIADGIDGCHRERFGSLGRRVDETSVCERGMLISVLSTKPLPPDAFGDSDTTAPSPPQVGQ